MHYGEFMKKSVALVISLMAASGCSMKDGFKSSDSGSKAHPVYGNFKLGSPYQVAGEWQYPLYDGKYEETGMASWYGPGFHGNKTANGATFDANALTAAHRTLPMPSLVNVTNLENGKSVTLLVNDRGPFKKNRIIDVSKSAAEKLDMMATGTAKVRVRFLKQDTEQLWAALGMGSITNRYAQSLKPAPKAIYKTEDSYIAANTGMGSGVISIRDVMPPRSSTAKLDDIIAQDVSMAAVSGAAKGGTGFDNLAPAAGNKNQKENTVNVLGRSENSPAPIKSEKAEAKKVTEKDSKDTQANFIQVGIFKQKENAVKASGSVSSIGKLDIAEISKENGKLYKLLLGPFKTAKHAAEALDKVKNIGLADAKLISQ